MYTTKWQQRKPKSNDANMTKNGEIIVATETRSVFKGVAARNGWDMATLFVPNMKHSVARKVGCPTAQAR